MFAGRIGLYIVYRRGGEGALNVSVGSRCFRMRAQIIAEDQTRFPTRMRRLHQVHMVSPRSRRTLSEEQFTGKPTCVVWYVNITQLFKGLDPSFLRRLKARHAN